MTRAGVLKLGLGLLMAGGLGYWLFEALGLEGFSAGIAAEALLVVVVVVWPYCFMESSLLFAAWHCRGAYFLPLSGREREWSGRNDHELA